MVDKIIAWLVAVLRRHGYIVLRVDAWDKWSTMLAEINEQQSAPGQQQTTQDAAQVLFSELWGGGSV